MFGFPKTEYKSFEKNFLKTVIFQFAYEKKEEVNESKNQIKEIFKDSFPRQRDVVTSGIQINIDKNQTQIVNPIQESNGIELKSNDGQKVLNITDSSFTFTTNGKAYKNFSKLKNDLINVTEFFKLCDIKTLSRVAIRKINFIDFTLDDNPVGILDFLFNENLIGNLNHFPNTSKINHNIQSLNYYDNSNYLNIKYGLNIPNMKGTIGQVIIDIDLYTSRTVRSNELFSIATDINNEIFNVFNWIVSDQTLKLLN